MREFRTEKILSTKTTYIAVSGKIRGVPALAIVKGGSLGERVGDVSSFLRNVELTSTKVNANYGYYRSIGGEGALGALNVEIIFPAGKEDIAKATATPPKMIVETPDVYRKEIVPILEKESTRLKWLYAILDGTAEQDDVLLSRRNPAGGFVLVTNPSWNGRDPESLLCLAIVRDRTLRTLRDLRGRHLSLLREMRDACVVALTERCEGVAADDLLFYFHYLPSFYHLHVHVCHAQRPHSRGVERARLLDDVIYHLTTDGEYYAKAPLTRAQRR